MRAEETALLTFSSQGLVLLQRLRKAWPKAQAFVHQDLEAPGSLPFARIYELMATHFHSFKSWVCIAPCGVVVRAIAPHIGSNLSDPAVVVRLEFDRATLLGIDFDAIDPLSIFTLADEAHCFPPPDLEPTPTTTSPTSP